MTSDEVAGQLEELTMVCCLLLPHQISYVYIHQGLVLKVHVDRQVCYFPESFSPVMCSLNPEPKKEVCGPHLVFQ